MAKYARRLAYSFPPPPRVAYTNGWRGRFTRLEYLILNQDFPLRLSLNLWPIWRATWARRSRRWRPLWAAAPCSRPNCSRVWPRTCGAATPNTTSSLTSCGRPTAPSRADRPRPGAIRSQVVALRLPPGAPAAIPPGAAGADDTGPVTASGLGRIIVDLHALETRAPRTGEWVRVDPDPEEVLFVRDDDGTRYLVADHLVEKVMRVAPPILGPRSLPSARSSSPRCWSCCWSRRSTLQSRWTC